MEEHGLLMPRKNCTACKGLCNRKKSMQGHFWVILPRKILAEILLIAIKKCKACKGLCGQKNNRGGISVQYCKFSEVEKKPKRAHSQQYCRGNYKRKSC